MLTDAVRQWEGGGGGVRPLKTSPRPTELEPLAWNDNGEGGGGGGRGLGSQKGWNLLDYYFLLPGVLWYGVLYGFL
jgi:hypothetical protein